MPKAKGKAEQKKKRVTVKAAIFKILQEAYDDGELHDLDGDKIVAAMKTDFPATRFNHAHLAWYKHKFLLNLNPSEQPKPTEQK